MTSWTRVPSAVTMAMLAAAVSVAPASAQPPPLPPGCERAPILGLRPFIRTICDDPIEADGSWMRARLSVYLDSTRSSCGGRYYPEGGCPPWLSRDVVPGGTLEDYYRVTWDTIPPGEPGHLG